MFDKHLIQRKRRVGESAFDYVNNVVQHVLPQTTGHIMQMLGVDDLQKTIEFLGWCKLKCYPTDLCGVKSHFWFNGNVKQEDVRKIVWGKFTEEVKLKSVPPPPAIFPNLKYK